MEKDSILFMILLEKENASLQEQISTCRHLTEQVVREKNSEIGRIKQEIFELKLKLKSQEVEYKNIFDTLQMKAALREIEEKPKFFGPIEDYFD